MTMTGDPLLDRHLMRKNYIRAESEIALKLNKNTSLSYSFTSPMDADSDPLHFELDISDTIDFTNLLVHEKTYISTTNWYMFTGTQFENLLSTGMDAGYHRNIVTYIIPSGVLTRGVEYYIRYRATDDGGTTFSGYRSDIKTW